MNKTITLNDHQITLAHLEKPYFSQAGFTKGDLVDYYRRIAPVMLPHLRARPLSLQRFPDGIAAAGFYQKEVPDYFPDWLQVVMVPVESEGEAQPQLVCEDAATLVYLANQGCITLHRWLSQADDLDRPDRLIFDLDPPEGDFARVLPAARRVRQALAEAGLQPFVMTTGSQGLHVVAPIKRRATFDTVRAFARQMADTLAKEEPDLFTTELRKQKRAGRIFLDYLRNAYAQTAVAPYAVRALPGAPVATPLDWVELDRSELHAQSYTLENIFRRLGQKEDPWRHIDEQARALPA